MEWISIKNKKPEEDGDYLVIDTKKDCWIAKFTKKYQWLFKTENENCCMCVCPNFDDKEADGRTGRYRELTHWMPLPKIPEDLT